MSIRWLLMMAFVILGIYLVKDWFPDQQILTDATAVVKMHYPDIEQLRCQYEGDVANGLLLLDEADPRGFARNWQNQFEQMPPVRHFGYALQWFAMACAVAVIFVVLNLRRIR